MLFNVSLCVVNWYITSYIAICCYSYTSQYVDIYVCMYIYVPVCACVCVFVIVFVIVYVSVYVDSYPYTSVNIKSSYVHVTYVKQWRGASGSATGQFLLAKY